MRCRVPIMIGLFVIACALIYGLLCLFGRIHLNITYANNHNLMALCRLTHTHDKQQQPVTHFMMCALIWPSMGADRMHALTCAHSMRSKDKLLQITF